MAVLAPIPSASDRAAMAETTGVARRERRARRMSGMEPPGSCLLDVVSEPQVGSQNAAGPSSSLVTRPLQCWSGLIPRRPAGILPAIGQECEWLETAITPWTT